MIYTRRMEKNHKTPDYSQLDKNYEQANRCFFRRYDWVFSHSHLLTDVINGMNIAQSINGRAHS